jgi:myo-inositol-1(or 4)-monophosphatase
LIGTEAGGVEIGTGAGGDRTVELDRLAEAVALEVLERTAAGGARFTVLSEELGYRSFGQEFPLVLIDPVDGSLNAKQGIQLFGAMLSLAEAGSVGSVRVGHVINLATGEAWDAISGQGALRNGQPLQRLEPTRTDRIEILGLESSPRSLARAQPLIERAGKVRILGSMALSIAYAAAGGLDVHFSPIRARLFDTTASLLMVRESGGVATDMDGNPLDDAPIDLQSRSTLLISADPRLHRLALDLLGSAPG